MKAFFVVLLAALFLASGAMNVIKQLRISKALNEIICFINLVKTEVHYTSADFEKLYDKGKSENYKYLNFCDKDISLDKSIGNGYCNAFNSFVSKIGTTDDVGQINICGEYKARFEEMLEKCKEKEKEKLQVNTALSLLGALTVLIFFL